MREIEKAMVREIEFNSGYWEKSFSCRDYVESKGYNTFSYYLWDNKVFSKDCTGVEFSFCGWSSQTTKNRLNAFLLSFWNERPAPRFKQVNFNMVLKLKDKEYEIDTSKRYRINYADYKLVEV